MSDAEIDALIQHRLEQARIALKDAQFLLDGGRSPQSVVNRSYYAMFYAGLALLQGIGKAPRKHAGVISLFDTEFVLKGVFPKQLSKDLHRAFELRLASDYRTDRGTSRAQAMEALNRAARFVDAVSKHLSAEPSDTRGEGDASS